MVPSWSLAVLFVLTVAFTVLALLLLRYLKICFTKRTFRSKYSKNSGTVRIGRRKCAAAAETNGSKRPMENSNNNKPIIPRIEVGRHTNNSVSSEVVSDTEGEEKVMRMVEKKKRLTAEPFKITIPSTGVYAHLDCPSFSKAALDTPATKSKHGTPLSAISNTSVFMENSYFTPEFRRPEQQLPRPSISDFARRFREHLSSAISSIGNSLGRSPDNGRVTTVNSPNIGKMRLSASEKSSNSGHKEAPPLSGSQMNAADCNAAYLSFTHYATNNSPA